MSLTPEDVRRLRAISPSPRTAPCESEPPRPNLERALRRERLDFEGALTERERFESMGVPYEVQP